MIFINLNMLTKISALPTAIKQYLVISANYWAFTLTDGALRMLVLLYFYQLGYSPFALATLFVFYEVFGVITNLVGGWLGARVGLNKTMHIGLFIQIIALLMLAVPNDYLTIVWLMVAQGLSGIAKDLNKMSAKSSIKFLVKDISSSAALDEAQNQEQAKLFKWVALLTGSKNTLKGVGFFLGGLLLTTLGFQGAVFAMALLLTLVTLISLTLLKSDIGMSKYKAKFSQVLANSAALNYLAAARLCLFAARDVWFVIALPVYLVSQLGWSHQQVGAFLALWIIGYGVVQAFAPNLLSLTKVNSQVSGVTVAFWSTILAIVTALILLVFFQNIVNANLTIIVGMIIFGFIFAVNSSLHSYLVLALAKSDKVSMNVGFYYMANALGRLLGTVLSGYLYQNFGLAVCLFFSVVLAGLSATFVSKVAR